MLVFARRYKNWLGNKLFREKCENRMIYVVEETNYHQDGGILVVLCGFQFPFLSLELGINRKMTL